MLTPLPFTLLRRYVHRLGLQYQSIFCLLATHYISRRRVRSELRVESPKSIQSLALETFADTKLLPHFLIILNPTRPSTVLRNRTKQVFRILSQQSFTSACVTPLHIMASCGNRRVPCLVCDTVETASAQTDLVPCCDGILLVTLNGCSSSLIFVL